MKALVIEVHNVAVVNVWRLSWADVRFPVWIIILVWPWFYTEISSCPGWSDHTRHI